MAAVPKEASDAIRSELAMNAKANASAAKRKAQSADVENAGGADRARPVQGRMRHQTVEVCQVNAALSDLFDGQGIAHSKVKHGVATYSQENGPLGAPLHTLLLSIGDFGKG